MARSPMSTEDYRTYRVLRETGALMPIDNAKLPEGGWAIIGCEDGDCSPELITDLQWRLNDRNGTETCLHLPLIVGGPAAASEHCPFFYMKFRGKRVARSDEVLFYRIEMALAAKPDLRCVGHHPHCACGMCSAYEVALWENLRFTFEVKDRVREEFAGYLDHHAVLPHFDLIGYPETDEAPGPFRTYHLDRRIFERLYQSHTSQMREVWHDDAAVAGASY